VITGFGPPRSEADRGAAGEKGFAGANGAGGASIAASTGPEDAIDDGALSTRASEKAKAKA